MNKPLIALGLAGLSLAAPSLHAQETARVLSSVPLLQQVAVPRQVCSTQQVTVEQPKTGAGAVMGAVAGGAIGNQIGGGDGRTLATIAGLVGGAMLGNRIEGQPAPRVQEQTTCSTQTIYETRTVGYDVTYEYAGRQYRVQSPQDPGPTLRVQVTPVLPAAAPSTTVTPVPAPLGLPARPISAAPAGVVLTTYAPAYRVAYPVTYPVTIAVPPPARGWNPHGGHSGHNHRNDHNRHNSHGSWR